MDWFDEETKRVRIRAGKEDGQQVQIEEGIVYINSEEKGETENWYNTITSNENIYGEKVY